MPSPLALGQYIPNEHVYLSLLSSQLRLDEHAPRHFWLQVLQIQLNIRLFSFVLNTDKKTNNEYWHFFFMLHAAAGITTTVDLLVRDAPRSTRVFRRLVTLCRSYRT